MLKEVRTRATGLGGVAIGRKKPEIRRMGMEEGGCEEKSESSRNRERAGKETGATLGNWEWQRIWEKILGDKVAAGEDREVLL